MKYSLLSNINSPEDVKKLSLEETKALCNEIRECIIETVSKNGGHLASNLGTVELSVALHRVFSSPVDSLLFDVGHQCYTHKLLTGRFKDFSSLRTLDGLSGFMKPSESIHDPFITGHSSNSISAAYGIYKAKCLKGERGTAVAIIGDGAMTGGMAYEALNNAGGEKSNFIVVLNDNKMSISKNVGALAKSLNIMRNKPKYHHFKSAFNGILSKIPFIGDGLYLILHKTKEIFKGILYKHNMFSEMGFNYLGPVDGHDIEAMEAIFKIAQSYERPSLIHIVTTKGKGYSYAESSPKNYHGVSSFDINDGADFCTKENFSSVAGQTLCELASKDDKICAITAAMTEGTGLSSFSQNFTDRFFDVGIAEQHAVTFGAGLASAGMKPFFAVYSSFLQRAYDQIVHDTAIGAFPLKLLVDRAGIVGEDGETHQGLLDVSFLTSIPNMTVYSPSSYKELKFRIEFASHNDEIIAIRYPRGSEKHCLEFDETKDYELIRGNSDKLVITYGRLFSECCIAKEKYQQLNILKLNKIYPINPQAVVEALNFKEIYFFEESVKSGGIAEHFATALIEHDFSGKYKIFAVENNFVKAADTDTALEILGLNSNAVLNAIRSDYV